MTARGEALIRPGKAIEGEVEQERVFRAWAQTEPTELESGSAIYQLCDPRLHSPFSSRSLSLLIWKVGTTLPHGRAAMGVKNKALE